MDALGHTVNKSELGRPHRRRVDRGAIGCSGGAGVSRLLLLGRPDPDRPSGHAGPAVDWVSVRRSRRARHAGGLPGGGRHHAAGAVELDRTGDQPGGAAVVGVAGAAARAARHSRLAGGAAAAVDLRDVHPAFGACVCVVGGGVELAADAGRAGVGVRRCGAADAHRQPAVCGDGPAGVLRRLAVFREGGGDPVRGVHDCGAARTCDVVGFVGGRCGAEGFGCGYRRWR